MLCFVKAITLPIDSSTLVAWQVNRQRYIFCLVFCPPYLVKIDRDLFEGRQERLRTQSLHGGHNSLCECVHSTRTLAVHSVFLLKDGQLCD